MSHRAHYALIARHEVAFHSDKWGALGLAGVLALGPERLQKWFEHELTEWPDAVQGLTLAVVPGDFFVVNVDVKGLKVSAEAGLAHLSERAAAAFPDCPELPDHLARVTPQVRHAFLVLLREVWVDWDVTFAQSPQPQVDWRHLQDLSVSGVWQAFKPLPSARVQGRQKVFLVQELKQLLIGEANAVRL